MWSSSTSLIDAAAGDDGAAVGSTSGAGEFDTLVGSVGEERGATGAAAGAAGVNIANDGRAADAG